MILNQKKIISYKQYLERLYNISNIDGHEKVLEVFAELIEDDNILIDKFTKNTNKC